MRVDTCLLCDAVTVREGLLHILGGGITQIIRPEYPAPLGLSMGLRILIHPTELSHPHELEVHLQDIDGRRITTFKLDMAIGDPNSIPVGEHADLPVAWDFPGKPQLPYPSRYSFELLIDGIHQISVPFTAVQVSSEGGEQQ